ncbi:MAG: toprim domain-containing protein [Deltaproteobacteria bacterium]|nr:toprim domain-containing protein [Deltaproteobacteria bacterium]
MLAESVIDALSLYANGFRNTIPLYGTQGFTADHESLFEGLGTKETYLVLDADEPGQRAAELLATKLVAKGIEAYRVELPEKDANAFFLRHTPEELEQLLKRANPKNLERSVHVAKRGEEGFTLTEHGFAVTFGARRYEAKGIARTDTQLKVTLKAMKSTPVAGNAVSDAEAPSGTARRAFELTTLDLYSARSREIHAKTLARLFGENEALVREDLMRLVEKAETFTAEAQARRTEAARPTMTDAEREEALAFLTDPALERRIVEDLEAIGLCGEETNKLLGYLVATSRLLDEPLSMVIQSRSGAGTSALQDAVLALMPPEAVCKYTRITDQALFYREGDSLKHKVLALEEAEGMGGAVYSIRALQSAGEVRILSTGKDPQTGQMVSRETVVEGPVSFLMTTTRPSTEVDGELSSRNLFTTVDESRARTEEILRAQRSRWTLEGLQHATARSAIQARHWNAQRLLESLAVVNRYADQLRFPPDSLRARRDQPKYLAIVAALALLGQKQRPIREIAVKGKTVRYVEVTPTDVALANRLATEALGHSLDELSPPSRKLLDEVRSMVKTRSAELGVAPSDYAFARRDVREWTGWSDFQIKVHIRDSQGFRYLWTRQGKARSGCVYELRYGGRKDGRRFLLGLTPAEELIAPAPLDTPEPNLEGAKRQ